MTRRYNSTLIRWYSFIFRYADTSIHYIGTDTIFRFFFVSLRFFCFSLQYFQFVFASDFFLVKRCSGSFSFRFDFFASFRLFFVCFRFRILLFRFDVNQVKSCHFFASKRNKIFALISIFASEAKNEGAPYLLLYHPPPLLPDPHPSPHNMEKRKFSAQTQQWREGCRELQKSLLKGSSQRPPLTGLVEPRILSLLHKAGGGWGPGNEGGGVYFIPTDPEQT